MNAGQIGLPVLVVIWVFLLCTTFKYKKKPETNDIIVLKQLESRIKSFDKLFDDIKDSTTYICKYCNTSIEIGDKFCPYCWTASKNERSSGRVVNPPDLER